MQVHFKPEIEKKLNDLATRTGRSVEELVKEIVSATLAAASILEIQGRVKPDPEGKTGKDYINNR